mmetsp:Transcript_24555/g.62785  ORF Transcript_24555/g.62785 Transcript_24555/m.62785 type:complete len:257 (-) Transcript_24555:437-1207(-)
MNCRSATCSSSCWSPGTNSKASPPATSACLRRKAWQQGNSCRPRPRPLATIPGLPHTPQQLRSAAAAAKAATAAAASAAGLGAARLEGLPRSSATCDRHRSTKSCAAAHVASCGNEVSKTSSAFVLFMSSGTCFDNMASNFSLDIPGRASTRSRCVAAGALTTTTASQSCSEPRSKSSGMSKTTSGSPRSLAACMNSSRAASTSGNTTASNFFRLAEFASPTTNVVSAGRLTPPSSPRTSGPKSASTGATAAPPGP